MFVFVFVSNVVSDWSDAKAIHLSLEELLKKEADRVRKVMNREVELVKKDYEKLKKHLAEALSDNEQLDKTVEQLTSSYSNLKDLPDMVAMLERETFKMALEKEGIVEELSATRTQLAEMASKSSLAVVMDTHKDMLIEQERSALKLEKERAVIKDAEIARQMAMCASFQVPVFHSYIHSISHRCFLALVLVFLNAKLFFRRKR